MKRVNRYSALLVAAAISAAASSIPAWADDATTTTTTTTSVLPTPTQATVSGKVSGLNFSSKSFWIAQDNKSVGIYVDKANMQYNGQTANIYRLMASPQVTVTGMLYPGTSFTPGGLLYADTVTITSGPSVRLQPSSYTQQAQPPFAANELAPASAGTGGTTAAPTTTTTGATATGAAGGATTAPGGTHPRRPRTRRRTTK